MAKYKYPAPFDQETPPIDLLKIPHAPVPPSPPLTVDIPVDKPTKPVLDSLYRDVMGDDLSLVYLALDALWVSEDQRRLAERVVAGRKDLNILSTTEIDLLDDLVRRYNDQGGDHEALRARDQRLPVSGRDRDRGEQADQEVQPESEDVLSDSPEPSSDITSAYDWLGGSDE